MRLRLALLGVLALFAGANIVPSCFAGEANVVFPPLEQWKTAIAEGNSAALQALYSITPAARISTPAGELMADADVAFWIGLKARNLKTEITQTDTSLPSVQQILVQVEVDPAPMSGKQAMYLTEAQIWQQQDSGWRLVAAQRSDAARLQQPVSTSKEIYGDKMDAHAEIKHALAAAARHHKRVLIVFGANWCYDCHVLDLAFHRPDLAPVLAANYELVHVDVGRGDKNQDLMTKYQVPMARGIPGVAVLNSDGTLLVSQKNGEFEKARALGPEDLMAFLNQWKPRGR